MLTLVYDDDVCDIMNEVTYIKEFFNQKNIVLGISESILDNTHFIKFFCSDDDYNKRTVNTFNLYIANILYKVIIKKFQEKELYDILFDTYFFLKNNETNDVVELCVKALKGEGTIVDDRNVYCINRKNIIIEKIVECIKENKEININGFITFRMNSFLEELEDIVDKIIEGYMVEREYTEFIKLLKYFVEIQDSKIDEVNIIIQLDGRYKIQYNKGKDILELFLESISDTRIKGKDNMDDVLISGLIANAPKVIKIHSVENCKNKELIETIKGVFINKVIFCSESKSYK
jgi:putative sporulation protein YtxC